MKDAPAPKKISRKLSLSKSSLKKLTTQTGIKAGAGKCTRLRTGCLAHTC